MRIFKLFVVGLTVVFFASFAEASNNDCLHFVDYATQQCACTGVIYNLLALKMCRSGETCQNTQYSLGGRFCGTDRVTHERCYLSTISYSCIVPPVRQSLTQNWDAARIDKLSFEDVLSSSEKLPQGSEGDKSKKASGK